MTVPCPQCAGAIRLQETTGFVACPFCGSSLVLDLTGVRPHYLYRPRHAAVAVLPLLRRFCHAQGLPVPSPLAAPRLTYFPFWRYATAGGPRLVPAWTTLETRWRQVVAPEAEQSLYDPAAVQDARVVEATLAEGAAAHHAQGAEPVKAGALVHIPFYEQDAVLRGRRMALGVEACSGRVYVDRLPSGARLGGSYAGVGPGLALVAFAAMFLGATVVPTGWLALLVVGLIGLAMYWLWKTGAGV